MWNAASHFDRQLNKVSRREHYLIQLVSLPWKIISVRTIPAVPIHEPSIQDPIMRSYTVLCPSVARTKEVLL